MSRPAWIISLVEVVEDFANVIVQLFDHRAVKRIRLAFAFPRFRILFVGLDAQLLTVLIQQLLASRVNRRMYQPRRVIQKKRFVVVLAQERQRVFAVLVPGVSVFIQSVRIIFIARRKLADPVGLHPRASATRTSAPPVSLIFRIGKRVVLYRHVPFARMACRVAFFLKCIGQSEFVVRHPTAVPGRHHGVSCFVMWPWRIASDHMRFLSSCRMHATHDRASTGSTRRGR